MNSVLSIFVIIPYLVMLGISIYLIVLFIKLANRGIKALDIYIDEKTNKDQ